MPMSFAEMNLESNILKALAACDYTTPTPVQEKSIPEILLGRDIVASAQTGTGKTAAFVLPALHLLTQQKSIQKPRILILTPTRELARQITQAAHKYGKFLRFNIISLVGGMPYRQQLKELSGRVDIIVATPGRLLDHMDSKRLDLSCVEMLVLDEADRMLDMGFVDDVKEISKATPAHRQTLLFSATVDSRLNSVIKQFLKTPVQIDLSEAMMAPTQIKQELYLVDNLQHKTKLLQHFVENGNMFKAIIFSATKINADRLAKQLRDAGHAALPLHGDLKQNQRNKTIDQLRSGKIQFLVATDIAARGINISDITHVINYDLPKFSEDYVHRIGRTGRAGKSGIAISLALPTDARHLQRIEKFVGLKFVTSVIEGLEPTKRSMSSPAQEKRSFGGRRSGGQGRPSGRPNGDRSERNFKTNDRKSSWSRGDRSPSADATRPRQENRSDNRSEPRSEGRRFSDRKPEGNNFNRRSESGGYQKRVEGNNFNRQPEGGNFRSERPARFEGSRNERSDERKRPSFADSRGSRPARGGKPFAGRTHDRAEAPRRTTSYSDGKTTVPVSVVSTRVKKKRSFKRSDEFTHGA